ncbi:MAG: hypothetical protein AAF571_02855 [Verrucomicrobiota bacterium]
MIQAGLNWGLGVLRAFMLWRNPIFIRYCHSKLRWKPLLGWSLVTFLGTGFIFTLTYFLIQDDMLVTSQEAAQGTLIPLIVIQAIILMAKGSFSVASGITREGIEGVLDYQRLSPMPPSQKIIGYLFGLPVLDYILFLLTVPFVAFAVWKGEVPMEMVLRVYGVFTTSVLLYHMTAFMAGMVVKQRFLVGFLSQLLMFLLYFILPILSKFGYIFFEHFTIRPTIFAEFAYMYPESRSFEIASSSMSFFALDIPCHIFSMLIQLLMLSLFTIVVYRKWRNENHHLLDKHSAVLALGTLYFALIGSMLPQIPTGRIFPSWGPRYLLEIPPVDFISPKEALFILGFFGVFSLIISILTIALITPNLDKQIKGLRRMVKLENDRVPFSDDESSSFWHSIIICGIAFTGWWLFVGYLFDSNWYEGWVLSPYAWLWALTSLVVPIMSFQMYLEVKGGHGLFIVLLIAWIVPLLGGILMAAASEHLLHAATYVAALSGFLLPFYSVEAGLVQSYFLEDMTEARHAFFLVLFLYATLLAILFSEWRKHHQRIRKSLST